MHAHTVLRPCYRFVTAAAFGAVPELRSRESPLLAPVTHVLVIESAGRPTLD
jgi:hypothetical protein